MTKQEFSPAFLAMCELYDKSPSKALMSLYYETVKHLDRDTWNNAVRRVIAGNKYASLPKPAEILEASGMNEDKDADALLALEKIKQAIRDHGPYQSIVFDDSIIHMLIGNHEGGWPGLCAGNIEEHVWLWKDWLKLYKVYAVRPVSHVKRLVGVTEGENTLEDLKVYCSLCEKDKPKEDCIHCHGLGYIDLSKTLTSYVGDMDKCLLIEGNEPKQIAVSIIEDLTDKLTEGM